MVTRDVVYINTCTPAERVFLLKPKSILDELPAESTNIESDNIVQRYSKRPRQLQRFCLADYVSKVNVIHPKGNKLPENVDDKNDDSITDGNSSDENEETSENENSVPGLIHIAKNGTKSKYRNVPSVIRYLRYNLKKDPENHYREQLMLFMPWQNEQKDLLGPFETYTAHYNSMKISLEAKCNEYEHHTEELELARQMMEAEEAEAEEAAYDGLAPNAEQENREALEEGAKGSKSFVYFNPDRIVEHRYYDIGIDLQSTCAVPTVETTGIIMPDEEYLNLLRSLNLR